MYMKRMGCIASFAKVFKNFARYKFKNNIVEPSK